MTGDSSRSRTSESFNKFVTRDVNNSSKIDKTSTTLIKELKNQYNEKKDIYLKTTSLSLQTIKQITKLYTDQKGNILNRKITPDIKNQLLQQLGDARLNLIIA